MSMNLFLHNSFMNIIFMHIMPIDYGIKMFEIFDDMIISRTSKYHTL